MNAVGRVKSRSRQQRIERGHFHGRGGKAEQLLRTGLDEQHPGDDAQHGQGLGRMLRQGCRQRSRRLGSRLH
jgi:hypothetical protein